MGRGRPPLQREKPPAVVSDAGKSENSLSQSLSISTPEVKKRGRKRKICVENVENAPVNDVASSASTSSESERYVRAGHAACSGSSTSPHRRSDNLLDALSPYFCASAQRRRLHQRGEYAVLSGKHRREKHATPSKTLKRGRPSCTLRSTTHKAPKRKINLHQDEEDESKTPKARGYKASASCSAALLKKARNSRTVKRPRELKCSIMPVSTSMKSSKRSFGASAVRALAAQPVQVQRSSEDSRNAYDYMARFENPTDKQFYEEIYDEFQRQRAEQMDFIVGNRGKALPGAIQIGRYYIRTWYSSPYPQEYASQSFIFICPYCLHYSMTENIWERHVKKCVARGPPGDEIYRSHNNDETISIFEVDGNVARIYCQNLCLLSKLFLDSKTLFYDVEPFLFYVLTKVDRNGFHFVGYFSKEKYNTNRYQRYHLSCIMTLPCFQRKGYGRFLIDFSYLLARREEMPGTPERPLSELGEKSFRAYWRSTILQYFADCGGDTGKKSSLKAICEATGMTSPDVKSALKELKFLKKVPGTASHQLSVNWCMIQMYIAQEEGRKRLVVYDSLLKWSPKVYSLEQDYQIPGVSRPTESPTKEPEIIEKITKDKKQQRTAAQNVSMPVTKERSRGGQPARKERRTSRDGITRQTISDSHKLGHMDKQVELTHIGQKRSFEGEEEEPSESRRTSLRKTRAVVKSSSIVEDSSDEEKSKTSRRRGRKKSATKRDDKEYRPAGRPRRTSTKKIIEDQGEEEPEQLQKKKKPGSFLYEKEEGTGLAKDGQLSDAPSTFTVKPARQLADTDGGGEQREAEVSSKPGKARSDSDESRSSSPTRTSAAPTPADEEKQPSSRTSSSLSSQSISTRCQSANEDQCNEYPECEESTTPIEPRPQSVQSNQSYTVNMGGDPDDNDDSPFVASNSEFPGYDEEERHQRSVCKAQPPQTNGIITHQNGTSTTEMPNLNSIGSNNCGSTVSDDDAPPRLSPIFSGNGPQPVKEKVKNRSQDDPNQMSISKQLSTSHVMPHPYMNGIHDCQTPYQMAPSSNAIPKSNWGSHERKESMVNSTTSPANSTLSARSIDGNIRSVDYEHLKSEFSSPQANDLSDHANSEKSGRSSTFSVPSRPDNLKNPPPQLLHPIMPEQAASSQQVPPEVPKTKPSSRRRNTLGTVYSQGAPLQPQYPNFNPMAASAYFPHGSHFAPPNYGYPIYANANPAQFHQATAASAIYPGTWSTQAQYAAQYSMHKQGMTHFPAAYYMAPPGAAMQGNGAHQPGDNRATQVPNGTAQNFTRYPTMDVNGSQSLSQFYNPSYGFVSANMPLNP
ncbi:hypothetical protein QR680_003450 [Steinernema hermaphroditum]|uniref:histone acetyltransferase n=1 Tax=Steinernema hermaphroditum TaxID=289476 RepID=A0AA39LKD3_9BILA|nr:hypothetical protein QR680_003450 [Steinernema hermaphroditum]